jgi:hypothetical protein
MKNPKNDKESTESKYFEKGEKIMKTEPEYQQPMPKRAMKGEQKSTGRTNYKGKKWC